MKFKFRGKIEFEYEADSAHYREADALIMALLDKTMLEEGAVCYDEFLESVNVTKIEIRPA